MSKNKNVSITREDAVELFEALGITTANKWNAKRMEAKLAKINEMVDADTDLEGKADQTLTTVLEAIEAEVEITVSADAAPKAKGKAGSKKAAEPKAETPKVKAPAKGTKKAAEPKEAPEPKAKKKAAEPETEPKENKDKTPGVRETRTRPFLAGVIIEKYGMGAGVTDAMVAELDKAYGKENPAESLFALRNAWHAIRGFQNGDEG